nr:MAG TPA: hypothetical protein [Caudoviricetes sp.]DAP59897.1 MAG TPA: hypothetical protein [Caudoviricetes sp.]
MLRVTLLRNAARDVFGSVAILKSSAVYIAFLLLRFPQSMFAHRLGTFLLHIFQSFKILRVKFFHDGLSLNVVQIAVHECLALFIGEFDAGSDHQVASVQMRGLDVAIIGEVRVDHPNAVVVLNFGTGGHNLGCKLVSSELFHNCYLHVSMSPCVCAGPFTVFIIHALRVIVKTF